MQPSDDVFDGFRADDGAGMWSAGTEKQGRIFFRNKAAMGTAARRGTEGEPQWLEAEFEFVPRHALRRREFQAFGQQFVLLGHA